MEYFCIDGNGWATSIIPVSYLDAHLVDPHLHDGKASLCLDSAFGLYRLCRSAVTSGLLLLCWSVWGNFIKMFFDLIVATRTYLQGNMLNFQSNTTYTRVGILILATPR